MHRSVATVILLLLVCAPLRAQEIKDALLAPFPIRDQFLLSSGFFFFEPEGARVLGENESLVTLNASDSNTFAKSAWISRSEFGQRGRAPALDELADSRFHLGGPIFLVDGETHRVELAMRHGFGRNFEMTLTIPVSTIGGGWSDRAIEAVHHALNIGNANREAFRRNSETVYLQTATAHFVRDRSAGFAAGDVAIAGKYELAPFEDRALSLAIAGAIELPTGDARTLDGSGSIDAGLQVLASRDLRKFWSPTPSPSRTSSTPELPPRCSSQYPRARSVKSALRNSIAGPISSPQACSARSGDRRPFTRR